MLPDDAPGSSELGHVGDGFGCKALEPPIVGAEDFHQHGHAPQVDDGHPGLGVHGDLLQDSEGADLALDVVRFQEVDEQVHPTRVSDGQLGGLLAEVKVQN